MSGTHYACYTFPVKTFRKYSDEIDDIFQELGGQDLDAFDDGSTVRYCCPMCIDSTKIDVALSDENAPWQGDPCFAVHAMFSDGIDFDDHQLLTIGRQEFEVNGNHPENPQVMFTLDPDIRLSIEGEARAWARAYAAFQYYCGKGRTLDEAKRHVVGGRAGHCPRCNSTSIDGEGVDIRGDHAVQECFCHDCSCTWRDVYMLIGAGVDPDREPCAGCPRIGPDNSVEVL